MEQPQNDYLHASIADIAAEEWRFHVVFLRAVSSLPVGERERYISRYNWFHKRVEAAIQRAGLTVVSLAGQPFDVGMAVTPLNIDEFDESDTLYVTQMVEPIIMKDDSIFRMGSVMLGRAEK